MIMLTDGAGNVSMSDLPPMKESELAAQRFAEDKIRSVVINMEHKAFDQGLAQKLADQLAAPCLSLEELKAEALYHTVKMELNRV